MCEPTDGVALVNATRRSTHQLRQATCTQHTRPPPGAPLSHKTPCRPSEKALTPHECKRDAAAMCIVPQVRQLQCMQSSARQPGQGALTLVYVSTSIPLTHAARTGNAHTGDPALASHLDSARQNSKAHPPRGASTTHTYLGGPRDKMLSTESSWCDAACRMHLQAAPV